MESNQTFKNNEISHANPKQINNNVVKHKLTQYSITHVAVFLQKHINELIPCH